ncbi:hypothetical protein JTB14_000526, partial [Gonioctena quinquepunctata]
VIKEEPIETKSLNEESKLSLTHFWENTNSNSLADDLAKPKLNQFDNVVILKNEDEDHHEYIDDLWTNNDKFKAEDDIDIVYEDVKPEICEEKPRLEIGPNFSCKYPIESGTTLHQDTVIERNNARSFKTKSLKHIIDRFPQLKIKLTNLQDLDNEWRRHALLDFDDLNIGSIDDADSYWHVIFNLKNSAGIDLFPNLKQVIALLLILPFSNASVERVFSDLFNVKNHKRNQLNTSTIRAILASKEGIESSGGCIKFVPSKKMLEASIWKKKS